MLDDGFEPVIRSILAMCPSAGTGRLSDRQTVMFSATWPEEIRALADKFLKRDVVRVVVGSDELSANHRVTQIVECVEAHEKDKKLIGLLEKYHKSRKNRVLVFVLYKKEAADLQNRLLAKGYNVQAIHGDKSQHDRTAALEEFKSGKTPLLIATDVAARGLDIPQVEVSYLLTFCSSKVLIPCVVCSELLLSSDCGGLRAPYRTYWQRRCHRCVPHFLH